jgi:hypothetical protein
MLGGIFLAGRIDQRRTPDDRFQFVGFDQEGDLPCKAIVWHRGRHYSHVVRMPSGAVKSTPRAACPGPGEPGGDVGAPHLEPAGAVKRPYAARLVPLGAGQTSYAPRQPFVKVRRGTKACWLRPLLPIGTVYALRRLVRQQELRRSPGLAWPWGRFMDGIVVYALAQLGLILGSLGLSLAVAGAVLNGALRLTTFRTRR